MTRKAVTPAAGSRIVLGNLALIKGWFVATGLWLGAATVLLIVATLRDPLPEVNAFGFWVVLMLWSAGGALLLGGPLALGLGFLLRPVRRQWVHVAVFFAVPTGILGAGLGGSSGPAALALGVSVGVAAALGRLSVCQDVEVLSPAGPPEGSSAVGA